MKANLQKASRLYIPDFFEESGSLSIEGAQAHYLKNVMRREIGDMVRVFNAKQGEYFGRISALSKKSLQLDSLTKLRAPCPRTHTLGLAFSPLPKARMDFLIEKAVELDVTDLYPIITEFSSVRKINDERIEAQIIEAAEQCERLDLAHLHPLQKLESFMKKPPAPLYAALERMDSAREAPPPPEQDCILLIGPEGGFSDRERAQIIENADIQALNLGENVLRAETAALAGLVILKQGR